MSGKVIIVGAGVAGIASAVELAKNNIPVQLIEARNHIGGRCFSFIDKFTGDEIDNGQHIFIGAYKNFFELLENIGTRKYIFPQNQFEINYFNYSKSAKLVSPSKFGRLPLLIALLRFELLDFKSKLSIIKFILKATKIYNKSSITAFELLLLHNQTKEAIRVFWEPLILATLNQSIQESPADVFLEVVRKMFSSINSAKIYFSSVGLSRLFEPSEKFLKEHNSQILKNIKITKIEISSNKVVGCYDANNKFYPSNALILALPFDKIASILQNSGINSNFSEFEYSTIISYYFWTKKKIKCLEINALLGTKSHWLFDRNKILQINPKDKFCYTVTISCANELAKLDRVTIENVIISDLINLKLLRSKQDIIHSKLLVDKKATVALNCSNSNKRHTIITEFENVFICGDWTATGLPATIEGAALSGKLAANYIKQMRF